MLSLPFHLLVHIINEANQNLSVCLVSKEFNNLIADDIPQQIQCLINKFKTGYKDKERRDEYLETTFKYACKHSQFKIMKYILDTHHPNVVIGSYGKFNWTRDMAFLHAIDTQNVHVVTFLSNYKYFGLEYRYCDNLKYAISSGNIEIINIILTNSNDFEFRQPHNNIIDLEQSPEYQFNGKKKVWEQSCTLTEIHIFHNTMFIEACDNGQCEIIKLLLTHPHSNSATFDTYHAYNIATRFGYSDILKVLMDSSDMLQIQHDLVYNDISTIYTWILDMERLVIKKWY